MQQLLKKFIEHRCFEFLNNWYGFIQGTNQHSLSKLLTSSENFTPKNQTELAESYGITKQTMNIELYEKV